MEAAPAALHLAGCSRSRDSGVRRPDTLRYREMRRAMSLGLILAAGSCSLPRTDAFFLRQATLAEPAPLSDSAAIARLPREDQDFLAVRGHRIAPGAGIILGYRRYSPGNLLVLDDEEFEKVTVWLADSLLAVSGDIDLARPDVVVRYTQGASAWPRAACYGTASAGRLRLTPSSGERLEADLSFEANLVRAHSVCGRTSFQRRITLTPRRLDRLSPWDGRAGAHIYDETYPEDE